MTEKARYHYGTGRRKTAVARVRMYPGKGAITVNGKTVPEYFGGRSNHHVALESPLRLTNTMGGTTSSSKLLAVAFQVRLAPFATGSRGRWFARMRSCGRCSSGPSC